MEKIKVVPLKYMCECPFYVETTNNSKVCLFKYTITKQTLESLSESPVEYNKAEWEADCNGKWENCVIYPLYYADEENKETILPPTNKLAFVDNQIDDYEPFEEESDEKQNSELKPNLIKISETKNETKNETKQTNKKESNKVNIILRKVNDPYQEDVDVLVYPSNIDLLVDDDLLLSHTHGQIQKECESISRPIQFAQVYKTSNGGENSKVKAKTIYHAVISGLSRLVAQKIDVVMIKSLQLAELEKNRSIAFLPFDCGTLDINETAMAQLSSVKEFLLNTEIKYLEKIIFVMQDTESFQSFKEYYKRIIIENN